MSRPDINIHDGHNYGGTCSGHHEGETDEFCVESSAGWCSSFDRGEAYLLIIEILELLEETNEQ